MNKKRGKAPWIIGALVMIGVAGWYVWSHVVCTEILKDDINESFDNTDYKDAASSVAHWGEGYITLNKLGSNFDLSNPAYIPTWVNTVATGDFDLDGWVDFVGATSDMPNTLAFLRNMGGEGQLKTFNITHWIDGSEGDASQYPTKGIKGQPLADHGHCGLTSGDYDGDGDIDFFFVDSQYDSPWNIARVWLYENRLIDGGVKGASLYFTQTDLTSAWTDELEGTPFAATFITSLDYDSDNDQDILIGNREGEVLLIRNKGTGTIDSNTFFIEPEPLVTVTDWSLANGGRGVSTVSIADFSGDGFLDVAVGSVTGAEIRYFRNDGTGHFDFYAMYKDTNGSSYDNEFSGASTVSICHDFDSDGDQDLIIGTDRQAGFRLNGVAVGGIVYYFKNTNGDFSVQRMFDQRPDVYDFDCGGKLDVDNDGDMDFLIADGNHSEDYYLFINSIADVYNLEGTAISTNRTADLDPNLHAITKCQIKTLDMRVVGGPSTGLSVTIYVSNDDGTNWEFYKKYVGSELKNYSGDDPMYLPEHQFNTFGSKFRWKALLNAQDDAIPQYPGASFETPRIDQIDFKCTYVQRQEYSRTSVVPTKIDIGSNGSIEDVIYAGSFEFPGWQGHLRAYDVTGLTVQPSGSSKLVKVKGGAMGGMDLAAGVSFLWDSAELLDTRSAAARRIFTAWPRAGAPSTYNYLDFTTAYLATLAPKLQDTQGDNAGLINFIRGEGRLWKLGDINHSNPLLVGPPNASGPAYDATYSTFKTNWQNRKSVIYVGANDGMIHCFDAKTGEEIWGFIPYNLVPRLRDMYKYDSASKIRYFNRGNYVDGSPVVADVYIKPWYLASAAWRTVLICGQGLGFGGSGAGGGLNYYFALDVTNPDDPKPLWQFTVTLASNTMGETWSVPAVGKVKISGADTWVAFVGSGYDNDASRFVGNYFYAIRVETGASYWSWQPSSDLGALPWSAFPVFNSFPGSPSIIDADQDGIADRVYWGDLRGKVRRLEIKNFTGASSYTNNITTIYADPWSYPIITKTLAVYDRDGGMTAPHVYFGTGGHDLAPIDGLYDFVSMVDDGKKPDVEWFIGAESGTLLPAAKKTEDLEPWDKLWADPVYVSNTIYFSTLTGNIDSVNPCYSLAGVGKLFSRRTIAIGGVGVGGSAYYPSSIPYLSLANKSRAAVAVGEAVDLKGQTVKVVYIQEIDSTIQRLEPPSESTLKVKSWREVYKIIK